MKKTTKTILCFCLVAVMFALAACSDQITADYSQYEKIPLTASWSYNFASVRELAESCDLAAYVKITGRDDYDKYKSIGVNMTIYTAEIQESLFGQKEGTIRIVMTGKIDDEEKKVYEIVDDPLMKSGDEFFVFARANENGTYTILSGPQGRFEIIDNKVYSLNVSNEQVAKNNPWTNITVDKQPKEDFYTEIKEYVDKR